MDMPEYGLDDFMTAEPYDFVLKITDPFEQQMAILKISKMAKECDKSINFPKLLDTYRKHLGGADVTHHTEFTGQPMQLESGDWICDDNGVRKYVRGQLVIACKQPIMPVGRLFNIDTGLKKTEIAFRTQDGKWQHEIFDAEDLASKYKIVHLSQLSIAVTSNNASALVDYLSDMEQANYTELSEHKLTDHMGWVDEHSFVPYTSSVVLDSSEIGSKIYQNYVGCSKTKKGEQLYMNAIREIRAGVQVIPRIVLAASLASVLVSPCNTLPFIVHLWGKTGTGKTVTLMLASSVWGAPAVGQYTRSCNATQVGLELLASKLNNLPLVLDELQTISNKKDFEDTMYELTEGSSRSRGTKTLGMQVTRQWLNCTITSGEQPITTSSSGGGVFNRIIDLPCNDKKLYNDPVLTATTLKECYGYLGKRFVELLYHDEVMEEVKDMQKSVYSDIIRDHNDIPEKQAQAASLIITADYILAKYITQDKYMLMPNDLLPFIASPDEIDVGKRGYDWLINWISSQRMHFFDGATDFSEVRTEIYGLINPDNTVTIISSVFTKACTDAGFNPTALKRWLKENDLSVCTYGRLDKNVRVSGTVTSCLIVKTAETVDMPFEPVSDGEQQSW